MHAHNVQSVESCSRRQPQQSSFKLCRDVRSCGMSVLEGGHPKPLPQQSRKLFPKARNPHLNYGGCAVVSTMRLSFPLRFLRAQYMGIILRVYSGTNIKITSWTNITVSVWHVRNANACLCVCVYGRTVQSWRAVFNVDTQQTSVCNQYVFCSTHVSTHKTRMFLLFYTHLSFILLYQAYNLRNASFPNECC